MEESTHQRTRGAELLFGFDVGPPPTTLAQHETNSGSTFCFTGQRIPISIQTGNRRLKFTAAVATSPANIQILETMADRRMCVPAMPCKTINSELYHVHMSTTVQRQCLLEK